MTTANNNTLGTLNDALHSQLSRLAEATTTGDALREEICRAKAMSGVACNIIENAKLALEAQRTLRGDKTAPAMLGIEAK